MAIKSRKLPGKRVTVTSIRDDSTLTVDIRALRDSEWQWVSERNIDMDMDFNIKGERPMGLLRDLVRLGLVDIYDVTDPDTGRPLEVKRYSQKMGDRALSLVSEDTLDAVADYIAPICNEIADLSKLGQQERDAVRPTSSSTTAGGLAPVADATETKADAP